MLAAVPTQLRTTWASDELDGRRVSGFDFVSLSPFSQSSNPRHVRFCLGFREVRRSIRLDRRSADDSRRWEHHPFRELVVLPSLPMISVQLTRSPFLQVWPDSFAVILLGFYILWLNHAAGAIMIVSLDDLLPPSTKTIADLRRVLSFSSPGLDERPLSFARRASGGHWSRMYLPLRR